MKLIIDPKKFENSNSAAEGVALEMKSRKAGRKGYAVVYDDGVDSFARHSRKLINAVWDLCSECRIKGKLLVIFENANHDVALKIKY